MAHVTSAYVGASQRRSGWQGAWAVTFRPPGRVLLQQAAQDGGAESGRKQVKNQEEDASSKPPGATTSVTREAEGRALAFLPCKMALPPAATEPRKAAQKAGELFTSCLSISVGTKYNLGKRYMERK